MPDFRASLGAFQPQQHRVDGLRHLVVFPMVTQNGSPDRLLEALLIDVIWPEFIDALERDHYSNALFVPIRFVDFTGGYDTNSAVLFPETVAMKELIPFTWGAIFADREAARFRKVVAAAAEITKLELPADAQRLLDDQALTERSFVLWDLVHDRTHMRGDLPFDPFMIKQRMPYFLYSLEELRCDLTAFREAVRLVRDEATDDVTRDHARLAQYTILFDRIFRFPLTGGRSRNYDGVGGQLLFAWLHQHHVLHWTDTRLAIDWDQVPDVVIALSDSINELYWASIDRPKTAHWLAAYDLVRATLTPNPASRWARGPARRDPRGRAEGLHGRGAGRRVPALDVLRGPRQEAPRRDRVDRGHHRRRLTRPARPVPGVGDRAARRPTRRVAASTRHIPLRPAHRCRQRRTRSTTEDRTGVPIVRG